jgi:hypothetical protein
VASVAVAAREVPRKAMIALNCSSEIPPENVRRSARHAKAAAARYSGAMTNRNSATQGSQSHFLDN